MKTLWRFFYDLFSSKDRGVLVKRCQKCLYNESTYPVCFVSKGIGQKEEIFLFLKTDAFTFFIMYTF
jgi:hypothetical protein